MSVHREPHTGVMAWFVRNPVAANLLMAMILVLGFVTAINLRTEAFPAFPLNTVTVTVPFLGGSPKEVEEGVAIKIEEALNGLEGVKRITSSVDGYLATVTVSMTEGYSLAKLKEAVKSRVDAISSFPSRAERPIVQEETETRHVLSLDISGDIDRISLEKTAKRVRDDLLRMEKVNKVSIYGVKETQISVEVSQLALRQYGLTIAEIGSMIQQSSLNLSGGEIVTTYGSLNVRTRKQGYFVRDFENITLRSYGNGGRLRLSDVATVKEIPEDKNIFNRFEGKSSIALTVELLGRDSVTLAADAVKQRVVDISTAGWLPKGVQLVVWNDASESIRERLKLMGKNALSGMLLVALMLALFLNVRVALWVVIGIPVSFAGTLMLMGPSALNYSLNELTTFGFIIVLGIVVDDAIVIGESIYSAKETAEGADKNAIETAIAGAKQVAAPATFGVLTTVAAFLPLTLISSEMGKLFGSVAVVVIGCLMFSLIESKWILPAHLARVKIDRKPSSHRVVRFWSRVQIAIDAWLKVAVQRYYTPLLKKAILHRYTSLCFFLALFIVVVGVLPSGQLRSVFFPNIESGNVNANLVMQRGMTVEQLNRNSEIIENAAIQTSRELKALYPNDNNAIRYSYSYSRSDRHADFVIQLASDAERSFSVAEVVDHWRYNIGDLNGVKSLDVYADGPMEFSDIEMCLSTPDSGDLKSATSAVKTKLEKLGGVNNVKTSYDEGNVELDLELTPQAKTLGLSYFDVTQQIRNIFYGYEVQRVQRGNEEVRVWVRYPKSERNQFSDLSRVFIRTSSGVSVPLDTVAILKRRESPSVLDRANKRRVVCLTAQSDKAVTSASVVVAQLEERFFPMLKTQYPGLLIEQNGEVVEEAAATRSLWMGFLLGLALIYCLLAIPLRSYGEPLVIMTAIPFGVIGAIIGHMLVGIPMSLLSFFGVLALSGVVVNDALVLTSHYNTSRHQGVDFVEAICTAGRSRFRAILLTSITTFIGLAPLLFERSEQAQLLIPMAVSLAFGILFATVITLLIIPVLLAISNDIRTYFGRHN